MKKPSLEVREIYRMLKDIGLCVRCRIRWQRRSSNHLCDQCDKYWRMKRNPASRERLI